MEGWTYILTYGKDLDIYAKRSERVGVDRKTKRVVIIYSSQEAKEQKGPGAMKAHLHGKEGEGQSGCRRDNPAVGVSSSPRYPVLKSSKSDGRRTGEPTLLPKRRGVRRKRLESL